MLRNDVEENPGPTKCSGSHHFACDVSVPEAVLLLKPSKAENKPTASLELHKNFGRGHLIIPIYKGKHITTLEISRVKTAVLYPHCNNPIAKTTKDHATSLCASLGVFEYKVIAPKDSAKENCTENFRDRVQACYT